MKLPTHFQYFFAPDCPNTTDIAPGRALITRPWLLRPNQHCWKPPKVWIITRTLVSWSARLYCSVQCTWILIQALLVGLRYRWTGPLWTSSSDWSCPPVAWTSSRRRGCSWGRYALLGPGFGCQWPDSWGCRETSVQAGIRTSRSRRWSGRGPHSPTMRELEIKVLAIIQKTFPHEYKLH